MKGVIHTSADFVRIKSRNPRAKGIMKNMYHISRENLYAFFLQIVMLPSITSFKCVDHKASGLLHCALE